LKRHACLLSGIDKAEIDKDVRISQQGGDDIRDLGDTADA